jgi:hypothetical protein
MEALLASMMGGGSGGAPGAPGQGPPGGPGGPESPEDLLKLLEEFERQGGNLGDVSPDLAVRRRRWSCGSV